MMLTQRNEGYSPPPWARTQFDVIEIVVRRARRRAGRDPGVIRHRWRRFTLLSLLEYPWRLREALRRMGGVPPTTELEGAPGASHVGRPRQPSGEATSAKLGANRS